VEVPRPDKRLLVITEIDGCFADGLSVATGCWLGHRTLQVVDYGKVAATIVDQHTFEAVRVWPNPRARTTAERLVTRAVDRWHAQLEGYQMMPYTDLLKFLPVKVNVSFIRSLVTDVTRLMCPGCGEDILYGRTVLRQGRPLCRSCAGDSYYVPLTFVSKATREEEGSNP
jgi:formylmethanofuran dehydrogenase subunit E